LSKWGDLQSWLSVIRYTTPVYVRKTLELLDANDPVLAEKLRRAIEKGPISERRGALEDEGSRRDRAGGLPLVE